jgi:hypothetical protein
MTWVLGIGNAARKTAATIAAVTGPPQAFRAFEPPDFTPFPPPPARRALANSS